MTASELKRHAQASAILGQASRTEGERKAAQSILDGIARKVADRKAVAARFTIPAMYVPMVNVLA